MSGQIHSQMFDVLKLDLAFKKGYSKIDPFKLIMPKYCTSDVENKKLSLDTMVFNASIKFHVLEAQPFTLLNQTSKNEVCLVNYIGFRFVLYSDDSACITKVPQALLTLEGQVILEPKFSTCDNNTERKDSSKQLLFQKCEVVINF